MKKFQKIYVEITNVCNLKCSFCPDSKRIKEFITVNKFEYLIKEICNFTNLITLHVKGEPLMHPHLKELLDICEQYNIKVNITTNGTLLRKNLEILSSSSSIRQINISLHSISKNENNNFYNFENYLDDVFFSTKYLLDNTNIIISYRLWNLKDLKLNEENKLILNKLENFFNVTNLFDRAKNEPFVKLSNNAFLNQDIEFTWPDINVPIISNNGTCQGLRKQVAILVDGTVVPCCLDDNGIIKLGNIYEDSFINIINSPLSKSIVRGFQENKLIMDLCKKCGYRTRFN